MPVASDTARAIGILGSLLWATGIARARQCRLELSLDHRLDELAHPIAQADFDRIKPIVEKMHRRLGLRLQGCRVRATAGHGVVSTGAQTPGLLGFQHPETTPPSIPTTPRTAPTASTPGIRNWAAPSIATFRLGFITLKSRVMVRTSISRQMSLSFPGRMPMSKSNHWTVGRL